MKKKRNYNTVYVCEKCHEEYRNEEDAKECEKRCKCKHTGDAYYRSWTEPGNLVVVKECYKCGRETRREFWAENDFGEHVQDKLKKIFDLIG